MDDCRATVSRCGIWGEEGKQRAEPVAKSINNWRSGWKLIETGKEKKEKKKVERGKRGERIGIGKEVKWEVRGKRSVGG